MLLTLKRKYREEVLAASFLWPSLTILVALLIYPLVDVVRLSFHDSNLQREVWVGLGNYIALADDPLFWRAFWQTVVFTVFSVALHLVIGLGLALLLNMNLDPAFRTVARGLLIDVGLDEVGEHVEQDWRQVALRRGLGTGAELGE